MGNCSCVDRKVSSKAEIDNTKLQLESPLSKYYEEHSSEMQAETRKLFELTLSKRADSIKQIKISKRELTEKDCEMLATVLPFFKNLSEIALIDDSLTPESIQILFAAISLDKIEKVSLSSNELGELGMGAFQPFLEQMQNLRELDISKNTITKKGVDDLCRILPDLSQLRTLNVKGNKIGSRGLKKIARSLSVHANMGEFILDSFDLNQDDVAEIRAILPFAALV